MSEGLGDLLAKDWDAVVIGAGLGGGLAARRLAEGGLSVLILELGPDGPRGERHGLSPDIHDPAARRARGFWPAPLRLTVDGRAETLFGQLGTGPGGTSAYYAASLERPARHDLEDAPGRPHPTGGWPVGADAFRPWLEAAERLLEARGAPDPLDPDDDGAALAAPPPLSEGDAALAEGFRAAGLHPYRAHVGIRYLPGCRECVGRKCPRACKMDGRSAGVAPARAAGAALIDRCRATALIGTRNGATHVEAVRGGERLRVRARRVVLAAGALSSPRLLIASAAEHWPEGCANESGLAGRNLMFHLNERIAVWPPRRAAFGFPAKALALRDLYFRDGMRLGLVQSMGLDADYGNVVQFLNERFDRSPLRRLRPLREFTRLPALAAARLLGDARVLVGILEDLPYPENRVLPDPPGAAAPDRDAPEIAVEYRIHDELRARRRAFRRALKRAFGRRSFFLSFEPELNLGHPCGTLRFGSDPRTSALDPDCRAWSVPNLYVADASFMPTSTGVNPSLAVAANALRVAETVLADAAAGRSAEIPA